MWRTGGRSWRTRWSTAPSRCRAADDSRLVRVFVRKRARLEIDRRRGRSGARALRSLQVASVLRQSSRAGARLLPLLSGSPRAPRCPRPGPCDRTAAARRPGAARGLRSPGRGGSASADRRPLRWPLGRHPPPWRHDPDTAVAPTTTMPHAGGARRHERAGHWSARTACPSRAPARRRRAGRRSAPSGAAAARRAARTRRSSGGRREVPDRDAGGGVGWRDRRHPQGAQELRAVASVEPGAGRRDRRLHGQDANKYARRCDPGGSGRARRRSRSRRRAGSGRSGAVERRCRISSSARRPWRRSACTRSGEHRSAPCRRFRATRSSRVPSLSAPQGADTRRARARQITLATTSAPMTTRTRRGEGVAPALEPLPPDPVAAEAGRQRETDDRRNGHSEKRTGLRHGREVPAAVAARNTGRISGRETPRHRTAP